MPCHIILISGNDIRLAAMVHQMPSDAHGGQEADLDHYDALTRLRDRFFGLRCAIKGAEYSNRSERDGLRQLADDLMKELTSLCADFVDDRHIARRDTAP
jgi:hypothetical protein